MASLEPTIVADNGTVIEAGGVYLTDHDDDELPYRVVKVLRVGGGGVAAGLYCQVTPGLRPVQSLEMWLKLYHTAVAERPTGLPAAVLSGGAWIIPVTVAMLLAWGAPTLPIRLGTEAVSDEELAEVAAVRYPSEPRAAPDASTPD